MTFRVTPYNTNSGAKAPSLYVDCDDEKNAPEQAKQLSGLARFENWNFNMFVTKIRKQ